MSKLCIIWQPLNIITLKFLQNKHIKDLKDRLGSLSELFLIERLCLPQETKVILQSLPFFLLPFLVSVLLSLFFAFTPYQTWTWGKGRAEIKDPIEVKATFQVLFSG